MTEPSCVLHPFVPIYNQDSRILILGSLPSVKSREQNFYYGHPRNRFWRLLAEILECPVPADPAEKTELLLSHHIALWDVIESCTIQGSSDASIRDVKPNDLQPLLQTAQIAQIFCNGATAARYYKKYQYPQTGIQAVMLPSTSPANAAWSFERLLDTWKPAIHSALKRAECQKSDASFSSESLKCSSDLTKD